MKYLLVFLLLLQPFVTYSQFFVGDSREFVKSALEKNDIKFTEDIGTDTTNRVAWIVEKEYEMILLLNTLDIVIRQTLIPEKENGVNEFVKLFNEDFVRISATEWRNYANGRIYKIELKYLLREPIFSITLAPASE